jgi:hypothetical protein
VLTGLPGFQKTLSKTKRYIIFQSLPGILKAAFAFAFCRPTAQYGELQGEGFP